MIATSHTFKPYFTQAGKNASPLGFFVVNLFIKKYFYFESTLERHLCTIFKLYTNSFCRLAAGQEILKKVTSIADVRTIVNEENDVRRAASGKNTESTVIIMLSTDRIL